MSYYFHMGTTVDMIAAALGVTDRRVREIAKELNITPKRVGRSMVFSRTQVERMKNRNTKPGPKGKRR